MKQQTVSILSNELCLSGVLHLPSNSDEQKVPLIVILHGFLGSKVGEHRMFVKAARFFTKRGFSVFRFDFSGCGESDGDYSNVMVTKQLKEVQIVLNYLSLIKEVDAENITLIGHSLGGAVASITAAQDRRIRKLILWSPVGKPYEDISKIMGAETVELARVNGKVDYNGFYVSHLFLEDLKNHHPLEAICSYKDEALIIHAKEDEDVPTEHTYSYFDALRQRGCKKEVDKYFVEHADHTFSSYALEEELFNKSFEWLEKYLDTTEKIAL
ncbi:alpha/beta hydrolase [Bacillus sp. FJAT-22090]|uniref:alpha/beta hydrolase n=1 Tax=Bacillus sp. FJAT-22090 TaxID=1581038 RepID=UPI0006B04041|nr:alpha/beta fold hydrolase [Bacillus sp. FJAT-22090]